MSSTAKLLADHKLWLEYASPHGLVVAAALLADRNLALQRDVDEVRTRLRRLALPGAATRRRFDREQLGELRVDDFAQLAAQVLDWPIELLAGGPQGPAVPDSLRLVVTGFAEELLAPTHVVPRLHDGQPPDYEHPYLLVQQLPSGAGFDRVLGGAASRAWSASPHDKFLYLLRERKVQLGLLFNGRTLRLLVAPRAQTPAWIDFELAHLCEPDPEPLAGLRCLLARERVFPSSVKRLHGLEELVVASRRYQAKVSIELADQVLEALWELLRGFVAADRLANPPLFGDAIHTRQGREDLYGGLLTVIMRLVFLLYAEDQDLMPASPVYQRSYSVGGLFEQLRSDQAQWPDTMDQRYGAWGRLLALFRLVHGGGGRGREFELPARAGQLFDPERHRFLEGQVPTKENLEWKIPRVSDGAILRVLERLLYLKGERISYGALDVEQIGSVYENMMGYAIEVSAGRTLALGKTHVVVDLDALLALAPGKRGEHLAKLGIEAGKSVDSGLRSANSHEALVDALEPRRSRFTPEPLPALAPHLQPSEERRRSGSHYTPRELTEPIVATTLDPLIDALGTSPTAAQLLGLKICDPAMGSGAFLVAACRYLAERVAGAWERHGDQPEIPFDEQRDNLHAKRLVATRCLYGVDKNPFAVDLAKLSLWLVTLAKQHPFTFVDHSLRHGDSLVGLTRAQIAGVTWQRRDVEHQITIQSYLSEAMIRVSALRHQIHALGDEGEHEKRTAWQECEDNLTNVRKLADAIIATFVESEKKDRSAKLAQFAEHVRDWREKGDNRALELADELQENLRAGTPAIPAFHWEIEFPEVFDRHAPGFDALVGNPPFLGGTMISTATSTAYLQAIQLHDDHLGNRADLCAYFFRLAARLTHSRATFSLIATNTISQGDTREASLSPLIAQGLHIYGARRRLRWPGAAAVIVSVVSMSRGPLPHVTPALEGREVDRITAFLVSHGPDQSPRRLRDNAQISYEGYKIAGQGFTFTDNDKKQKATPISAMHELLTRHPKEASAVRPYIGGAEINENHTHNPVRFVIYFGAKPLDDVGSEYPNLLEIVREKVLPERLKSNRKVHRERWWQYGEVRPGLTQALSGKARVLVNSQVSAHLAFAFQPTDRIFAHTLNVFVDERDGFFAILQSRVHEIWARFFGSTLEDRLRYTPTDCFETFPFPTDWASNAALEQAGRDYYEARARWMVAHDEGLTTTYNRFHDPEEQAPEILALRALHAAMDRAVLDAYGWTEIATTCTFQLDYEEDEDETLLGPADRATKRTKKKPWRLRWPDAVHDEVLGKLLERNLEIATAEAGAAAAEKASAKKASAKKASAKKASAKKASAKKLPPAAEPEQTNLELPDEPTP